MDTFETPQDIFSFANSLKKQYFGSQLNIFHIKLSPSIALHIYEAILNMKKYSFHPTDIFNNIFTYISNENAISVDDGEESLRSIVVNTLLNYNYNNKQVKYQIISNIKNKLHEKVICDKFLSGSNLNTIQSYWPIDKDGMYYLSTKIYNLQLVNYPDEYDFNKSLLPTMQRLSLKSVLIPIHIENNYLQFHNYRDYFENIHDLISKFIY
jgi:hypothetical protein